VKPGVHSVPAGPEDTDCGAGGTSVTEVPFPGPAALTATIKLTGVGDPACDTTIAWTFLSGQASRVFRQRLPVDAATWTRGRGWAIWKAMKVLAGALDTDPEDAAFATGVIDKIMADHLADTGRRHARRAAPKAVPLTVRHRSGSRSEVGDTSGWSRSSSPMSGDRRAIPARRSAT